MTAIYPLGVSGSSLKDAVHGGHGARTSGGRGARHPRRRQRRARSRLRHDGRSGDDAAHRHSPSRRDLFLLLGRLPHQIRGGPGEVSRSGGARAGRVRRRRARSSPARCIPRCARTARAPARSAAWRSNRRCRPPTPGPIPNSIDMTRRFWIGARADVAGRRAGDGRASVRLASACRRRSRTGCSSRFATPVVLWAGWPFFVRGCAVAGHAQSQHVHADRARHRRRLGLQRRRDACAGLVSAGVPRP